MLRSLRGAGQGPRVSAGDRFASFVVGGRLGAFAWRLEASNTRGEHPLRTLDDLVLHRLALVERPEAVRLDERVVDEHVSAVLVQNEPVTFFVVEPFYSSEHRSHSLL